MKRKNKWSCENIVTKLHQISEKELKFMLADLWEILLTGDCQPALSFQTVRVTNSDNRLSQPNRKASR